MSGDQRSTLDDEVRALVDADHADEAAVKVVRVLGPEVYGFLRAALSSPADADEVFSRVSERVWHALPKFRWLSSLRTWVYVIARRETSRFVLREKRRQIMRAPTSMLEEVVAAVRTETRSILRSHKLGQLRALRDALPADDRMLLILRIDRDLSWQDIARTFLSERFDDDNSDLLHRESARLRKRFQLVRTRLAEQARAAGLVG